MEVDAINIGRVLLHVLRPGPLISLIIALPEVRSNRLDVDLAGYRTNNFILFLITSTILST